MDLGLRGKRALVTGGSKGIGLAVARGLAAEGADVALLARDADALETAAESVRAAGVRVVAVPADTRDDASVRAAVERVVAELGGIDILVNAAANPASGGRAPGIVDIEDDLVRTELETKLLGYLRTARAVAPYLVAQGWGRIVNISGLNARTAGNIAGSVRNVAVAALTKNLADELGPHGVNVTVVHPGMTETERTPGLMARLAEERGSTPEEVRAGFDRATAIGRMPTGDEVADVVVFLCSPRSVAVSGDAVAAGGGIRGPIHY
ncbi:SDR family NAD(P)-dependent oxidoreductase [Motilibacter rhizosphaerae]|nr:SDR family NAD(P)-dependent oxidoreductase [Motilibacter rhizosphaerae]